MIIPRLGTTKIEVRINKTLPATKVPVNLVSKDPVALAAAGRPRPTAPPSGEISPGRHPPWSRTCPRSRPLQIPTP